MSPVAYVFLPFVSGLESAPSFPSMEPAATLGEGLECGFVLRQQGAVHQAAMCAERRGIGALKAGSL